VTTHLAGRTGIAIVIGSGRRGGGGDGASAGVNMLKAIDHTIELGE
jgi:hypothetical protein